MTNQSKIKVGDKFVEGGRVYRVHKVSVADDVRLLHYRPYFKDSHIPQIECSIPECNIVEANIRIPVSEEEIDFIFEDFSKRGSGTESLDTIKEKSTLLCNDIFVSAKILKIYWTAQKKDENFNKSKRDVLELAFEKVIEEIALVRGTTLIEARETIKSTLV